MNFILTTVRPEDLKKSESEALTEYKYSRALQKSGFVSNESSQGKITGSSPNNSISLRSKLGILSKKDQVPANQKGSVINMTINEISSPSKSEITKTSMKETSNRRQRPNLMKMKSKPRSGANSPVFYAKSSDQTSKAAFTTGVLELELSESNYQARFQYKTRPQNRTLSQLTTPTQHNYTRNHSTNDYNPSPKNQTPKAANSLRLVATRNGFEVEDSQLTNLIEKDDANHLTTNCYQKFIPSRLKKKNSLLESSGSNLQNPPFKVGLHSARNFSLQAEDSPQEKFKNHLVPSERSIRQLISDQQSDHTRKALNFLAETPGRQQQQHANFLPLKNSSVWTSNLDDMIASRCHFLGISNIQVKQEDHMYKYIRKLQQESANASSKLDDYLPQIGMQSYRAYLGRKLSRVQDKEENPAVQIHHLEESHLIKPSNKLHSHISRNEIELSHELNSGPSVYQPRLSKGHHKRFSTDPFSLIK